MNRVVLIFLLTAFLALAGTACSKNAPSGPSPDGLRVLSVSPTLGSTTGGTAITITGSNFVAGATVTVGGVAATSVQVVNATTITAVTAPGAAGPTVVSVSSGGQSASLSSGFSLVAPTPGANQPPTIQGLTAQGSRLRQPPLFADLGEELTVTATVLDVEAIPGSLTYEWSAAVGAFTGSGNAVSWRAPQQMTTPGIAQLAVTVVERYSTPAPNGQPVQHQHRVSRDVTVRVHDSARELADMSRRFLDEFSKPQTNKAWQDIMRDFDFTGTVCTDTNEVLAERTQVIDHYTNFFMNSYTIGTPNVTVNFGSVCVFGARQADACVTVPVSWDSTDNSRTPPVRSSTSGIDHLSAIYSTTGSRWWLCSSRYQTPATLQHRFYSRP